MHLYLVQHAKALSKAEDGSRSLSEEGVEEIKRVAAFARGLKIEVRKILHSGKMRALQTAQVLSDYITADMGVLEAEDLYPMDDPEIWFDRISKINEDIMLVGHLPYVSKLASKLLCGDKEKKVIEFQMGCILCMKRHEDTTWSVEWMIGPEMVK